MARGGGSRTAKRNIARADDMTRALDLRRDGKSLREIAVVLECSVANVHKLITTGIKSLPVENAEALRAVEGDRLDRVIEGNMPKAIKGNAGASDIVIKAVQARAKLFGLNAKEQIDISGALALSHDAHDQLLDRLARLAAAAAEGEGDSVLVAGGSAGPPALLEGVGEAPADPSDG